MSISVKTPQAFVALVKKDPAGAQAWLKQVAQHSEGLLPADQLATLQKVAAAGKDAFIKGAATLQLDALFGTGPVGAIGDNPNADLPVIHGKLSVDRGTRMNIGEQGYREWPDLKLTLKADDGRSFTLESDHNARNDIFTFIPGTDVMAFADQEVTIRGFLDQSGKALRVTEFSPGKVQDFVSGRVVVSGDDVQIRARGRGLISVKDKALKAELKQHNNLGVILEGKTSEKPQPDGSILRTFEGKSQDYWMLVRLTTAPAKGADGTFSAPYQAATSTGAGNVLMPADQAKNVEVNDRMYVLGRFDGNDVRASKATPSAGSPWTTAAQQRGAPMRSVIEFTEAQEPV